MIKVISLWIYCGFVESQNVQNTLGSEFEYLLEAGIRYEIRGARDMNNEIVSWDFIFSAKSSRYQLTLKLLKNLIPMQNGPKQHQFKNRCNLCCS